MEDDDLDINRLLDKAADPPPATPDSFREVMARYRRGRTRTLVVALVAVSLLGPAVGIAVGRATTDGPVRVAAGSPTSTPTASDAASGSTTQTRVDAVGASGVMGFAGPPAKRLFIRTTADGVAIRAYLHENQRPDEVKTVCAGNEGSSDGNDGSNDGTAGSSDGEAGSIPCPSQPPPECFPDSLLQAELSNEGAVDPGFMPMATVDQASPLVVLHAAYFGVSEGDPAAWVAVKTGDGVAQVRVRFADGATDEMAPAEGYAVLAHATAAPPTPPDGPPASAEEAEAMKKAWMPQGTVEALDASGAVVATADLAATDARFSDKCMPHGGPVPLPEPVPPSDPGVPGDVAPPAPAPATAPAVRATTPPTTVAP